jgi:hypothetical protein
MDSNVVTNFIKGMGAISLTPDIPDTMPETNLYTAWEDVGTAFKATGTNMWQAFHEARTSLPTTSR